MIIEIIKNNEKVEEIIMSTFAYVAIFALTAMVVNSLGIYAI